jgi:hypothetical protein
MQKTNRVGSGVSHIALMMGQFNIGNRDTQTLLIYSNISQTEKGLLRTTLRSNVPYGMLQFGRSLNTHIGLNSP